MSKVILLVLSIAVQAFLSPSLLDAQAIGSANSNPNVVVYDYYALPSCHDCQEFLADTWYEFSQTAKAQGIEVKIIEYDILDPEAFAKLKGVMETQGIPFTGVPVLVGPGAIYQGQDLSVEILSQGLLGLGNQLGPAGSGILATTNTAKAAPFELSSSLFLVLSAGFIDGINPCALTTLLFLISALGLDKGRRTLVIGFGYALGVFLSYYAIGLGLIQLSKLTIFPPGSGDVLNGVIVVILGIFAVLSLRDAYLAYRGKAATMTLTLPKGIHGAIHGIIRPLKGKSLAFAGAAFLGALVSILEFVCTGQVYLPTLVYMNQSGVSGAWALLALYNVAFVTPLVIILLAVQGGLQFASLHGWFKKNIALTKVLLAILFIGLGIGILVM